MTWFVYYSCIFAYIFVYTFVYFAYIFAHFAGVFGVFSQREAQGLFYTGRPAYDMVCAFLYVHLSCILA
jgi:hypothetical protein